MPSDVSRLTLTCLLAGVLALPVIAQEAEEPVELEPEILPLDEGSIPAAAEDDADETVEEIIVIAPRPGSRRGPIAFDDPERARLLRELYQSREDQEELARLAALADEQDRRIRLGYNPDLERPPSLDERMATPQRETTQPATIFTIQW